MLFLQLFGGNRGTENLFTGSLGTKFQLTSQKEDWVFGTSVF